MKAKDYGHFVKTFASFLIKAGAKESAKSWQQILPLFTVKPEITVAQICKAMHRIKPSDNAFSPFAYELINLVPELVSFLEKPAKRTYITDTNNLAKALSPLKNISICTIVELTLEELNKKSARKQTSLRTELIADYVSKLEANLGEPDLFAKLVQEIQTGDKKLTVPEIKQIALDFSKRTKSEVSSKIKAIAAIKRRHEALMIGRAKSEATGGSIAA